jgi:hypothetical protein
MLSWRLTRDATTASDFMQDLAGRLANRVQRGQLTPKGWADTFPRQAVA